MAGSSVSAVEDDQPAALRLPPDVGVCATAAVTLPSSALPAALATPPASSICISSRRVAPRRIAFSTMALSAAVQLVMDFVTGIPFLLSVTSLPRGTGRRDLLRGLQACSSCSTASASSAIEVK